MFVEMAFVKMALVENAFIVEVLPKNVDEKKQIFSFFSQNANVLFIFKTYYVSHYENVFTDIYSIDLPTWKLPRTLCYKAYFGVIYAKAYKSS